MRLETKKKGVGGVGDMRRNLLHLLSTLRLVTRLDLRWLVTFQDRIAG